VDMGPVVNCTGLWLTFRKRLSPSRIAQMFANLPRCDWKRKYLPSGVQLPQHSAGGLFYPESNGWRFFPSADTSQSDVLLL